MIEFPFCKENIMGEEYGKVKRRDEVDLGALGWTWVRFASLSILLILPKNV